MADTKHYIRSRGKVTGPFDVETLTRLVRRGMLTGVDEISENRQTWSRAADFEELFPARKEVEETGRGAEVETNGGQADQNVLPIVVSPSVEPVARYFYRQGGETVGPIPAGILKSLAVNGTLKSDDIVWAEGAQTAVSAGQMTMLMPMFHGRNDASSETLEELASSAYSHGTPGNGTARRRTAPVAMEYAARGQSYKGMATASMVLALCGLCLFGFITGVLAIIFAGIAMSGMGRTGNNDGKGMAVTGLVVGIIDIVGWLIYMGAMFG